MITENGQNSNTYFDLYSKNKYKDLKLLNTDNWDDNDPF